MAFIPCGAPLASARSFVTGETSSATSPAIRPLKKNSDGERGTVVKMVKLPFGKGKENRKKAPAVTLVGTVKNVEGQATIPVDKSERDAAFASATKVREMKKKGIPKFYNPTTARQVFRAKAAGEGMTPFDMRPGKSNNERVNENGTFRNMDPYTPAVVWCRPGWSPSEAEVGIAAAIRSVFGNAYLFDSELAEFSDSISCVKKTADMREFVRALGLSSAYRSRFFEKSSNQRFVELNFKHFLGRAPRTQGEISKHIQILTTQGYNAEINSHIDSAEYNGLWGKSRVPAVNFRGGHPYNNDMNKLAVLNGPFSTSDQVTKKAVIVNGDNSGYTGFGVYRGLPEAWRGENTARDIAGPLMAFPDTFFWNAQVDAIRDAELKWKGRFGSWFPYYYKNSLPYKEIMKPKLTNTASEVEAGMAALKYGSTMGKFYVGTRKSFDMAPEIILKAPTEGIGGAVTVAMKTIEPVLPDEYPFNRKE